MNDGSNDAILTKKTFEKFFFIVINGCRHTGLFRIFIEFFKFVN